MPAAGPAGYAHRDYAAALAEFGTPRRLPASGGWILERAIPGTAERDAMGPYPLFACSDWERLADDLDGLGPELVSLVLVADPLADVGEPLLRRAFPDLVRPFKAHFTVDLARPLESHVDRHHQRNARKAARALVIERVAEPASLADGWTALYAELIARHGIQGMSAFSPASFARQLAVPGLVMYCARREGAPVAMTLWYVAEGRAYYHLGASSPEGYAHGASFGLFREALGQFARDGVACADLGAGAGAEDKESGLSRFKRGWATGTRTAYLCGRIFDRGRYDALSGGRETGGYFPAYRAGEFA